MITLYDLLQSQLLSAGDSLFFYYKHHRFSCQVNALGVMYSFKSNGKVVFTERLPFDSLSVWADTCIQELANEYVTRFSSFKRTRHLESGLSLNTIRQLYVHFALPKAPVTSNSMATLRQYISSLSKYCKELEQSVDHWERYQLGAEKRPPETIHFKPSVLKTILTMEDGFKAQKHVIETNAKKRRRRRKLPLPNAGESNSGNGQP